MLTRRGMVCGVGACMVLAGCAKPISFPAIERATDVRVLISDLGERTSDMGPSGLVNEFDDQVAIDRLLAFVNARRDKFVNPTFGPPIPEVHVEIRDGDQLQSVIASGPNFFQRATFWTRSASPAEVAEFLSLIGVNLAQLRFPPAMRPQ